MDNNEKIILEKINKEFRREVRNTELPRSLSTENITAMLKESGVRQQSNIKEMPSVSSGRKKAERSLTAVKSIISVAAALVLVVMTALLYNARREISVLTEQNNLSGEELSPEKIEFHIINEVKKSKPSGSTEAYEKTTVGDQPVTDVTAPEEKHEEQTTSPEPSTMTAEQSVPVQVTSGATVTVPDTEFAVSDGSYIYRVISVKNECYIDIISLSTLERVADNPIRLGDRCDEISIQNNILTAVYKNRNSGVLLKFFDVGNKLQPALVREYYQKGDYEFLSLSAGKICLVTRTNGSPPDFTVNGVAGNMDDGSFEIDALSPYYTLISVTDADNLKSDFVRAKIRGKLENCLFVHSNLYASCTHEDAESGAVTGEICRFALDGSGLNLADKFSAEGRVAVMAVMNDGVIAAAVPVGRYYNLKLFKAEAGEFSSAEGFYTGEIKKAYCLDNSIAFTGTAGICTVKYNRDGEVTVSSVETAFNSSCKIFESDKLLISVSAPDSRGKAAWTVLSRSGSMISFNLDSNTVRSDTSREMLVSGSTGDCAVPVTVNGSKGYLIFSTDGSGALSSYPAPYVYNSTGKEICLISGDNLYIVSSSRVTAVSVSEIVKK